MTVILSWRKELNQFIQEVFKKTKQKATCFPIGQEHRRSLALSVCLCGVYDELCDSFNAAWGLDPAHESAVQPVVVQWIGSLQLAWQVFLLCLAQGCQSLLQHPYCLMCCSLSWSGAGYLCC